MVYIGQAGARKNGEGILNRLQEHRLNPNMDYWTEAVAFTTSNNTFGPTEISYLENRFCNMALQAQRYEVKNANEPTMGNITEEKECEMEEFIDNVKILINTLGYKVLVPVPKATDDTVYLYCKGSGTAAKGFVSAGDFTVLKDSVVSDHIVPSLETRGKSYFNLRNALVKDGVIVDRVFTRDYEFNVPSAASAVVMGHTSNGNVDWKTADGTRLKDMLRRTSNEQRCVIQSDGNRVR